MAQMPTFEKAEQKYNEVERAANAYFKINPDKTMVDFSKYYEESWRDARINIAVTGQAGSGKSTFINTIRNVRQGDPGFADVNPFKECTKIPTEYSHPDNRNIKLWDLPGVGTPRFTQENYLEAIDFSKFDFYVIMTGDIRFHENDLWLAQQVQLQNKRFFFVRTKVDIQLEGVKRHQGNFFNKAEAMKMIRTIAENELFKGGVGNVPVFLINALTKYEYEFRKLHDHILNDEKLLSDLQRQAMTFVLSPVSENIIKGKLEELLRTMIATGVLSTQGATFPIPEKNIVVDLDFLFRKIIEYRRWFGLDDATLMGFATSRLRTLAEQRKEIGDTEWVFENKEQLGNKLTNLPTIKEMDEFSWIGRLFSIFWTTAGTEKTSAKTVIQYLNLIVTDLSKCGRLVLKLSLDDAASNKFPHQETH